MAEIRLNKLTRQFNIGLQVLVDFLNENGANVELNPNIKISDEFLPIIEKRFANNIMPGQKANIVKPENIVEKQNRVNVGDIIDGIIIGISFGKVSIMVNDIVTNIHIDELRYNPDIKVGDCIKVKVECVVKESPTVSHRLARIDGIQKLVSYYKEQITLSGRIKNKLSSGGFLIEIMNTIAFLPKTLIDDNIILTFGPDPIGKEIEIKIVSLDTEMPLVVVSQIDVSTSVVPDFSQEVDEYFGEYCRKTWDICDDEEEELWGIFEDDNNWENEEDKEDEDVGYERSYKNQPPLYAMRYTAGVYGQCPYCRSKSVKTFFDGTALCISCGQWYRYA